MAITKQSIIEGAYQDIGFDGNLESARLAQGLRTLDRMVAGWLQQGIDIGYLRGEDSSLSDDSGILFQHLDAVQMNLALALAQALAINVSGIYAGQARVAYVSLYPQSAPDMAANPMMPVGAGNTRYYTEQAPFQAVERDTTDELADTLGIDVIDDAGYTIIGD